MTNEAEQHIETVEGAEHSTTQSRGSTGGMGVVEFCCIAEGVSHSTSR